MLRLITDFDGPIMDVSARYYHVYHICLERTKTPDQRVTVLSKAEFWHCKRAQIPEREIGRRSGLDHDQARRFARLRRELVHQVPYLVHDRPVPKAIASLETLQACGIDLAILTMRRERELAAPLERYNIDRFFPPAQRYCIGNDYRKTGDVNDKTLLMGEALATLPPATKTWMIGDTEADIVAAQTHNIPVIGVLSGIRNRDRLANYYPDRIVPDLAAALEIICPPLSISRS
ncbi:MAG: HAD family hydrolase [Spirulina sp. DLM2.Bin59]|nr:MAG: HAD family hydrolase [Spirulina sp. DLM2.Bin59]